MTVNIKLVHPEAEVPRYQTPGSAGFDLAIVEDVTFDHFLVRKMAPTGLVIETPLDHVLLLTPRSSTYKKWHVKLANTVGVVDSDYAGNDDEVFLNLLYEGEEPLTIPAGTRLAQGLFVPVVQAEFQVVLDMTQQTRGGFGSTG